MVTGRVVSDKMDKTITVCEDRLVKHPRYGKYMRRTTTYKAHDQDNTAKMGDTVEITYCRPMSKTKNWRLVKIVRSSENLADSPGVSS
jgi:small subunit ribosomal protein S17